MNSASYGKLEGIWTPISNKEFYREFRRYCESTFPGKMDSLGANGLRWERHNLNEPLAAGASPKLVIALDQFCRDINLDYRVATHEDFEKITVPVVEKYGFFGPDGGTITPHSLVLYSTRDNGMALKHPAHSALYRKGEPARLFNEVKRSSPDHSVLVLNRDMQERDTLKNPAWMPLRGLSMDKDLNIKFTDESVVMEIPGNFCAYEDKVPYQNINMYPDTDGIWVASAYFYRTEKVGPGTTKYIYDNPLGMNENDNSYFILVKPGSLSD